MSDAPVLLLDPRGPTLEIPAAGGEVLGYLIERDPDADGWGVVLRRLDGLAGPYHVGKAPARLWRCDCPDARYRARREARVCKHVAAVRSLYSLVVQLCEGVIPCSHPTA